MYTILGEINGKKSNHKFYIMIESETSFDELDFENLNINEVTYSIPIWRDDQIKKALKNMNLVITKREKELKCPIKCEHFLYYFKGKKVRLNFEINKFIETKNNE